MYALYNRAANEFLTCTFQDVGEAVIFACNCELEDSEVVECDSSRHRELQLIIDSTTHKENHHA